jgi:hypothetical protein
MVECACSGRIGTDERRSFTKSERRKITFKDLTK